MFFIHFSTFLGIVFLVFAAILFLKKTPIHKANIYLAATFFLMSTCGFWLSFLNYAMVTQNYHLLIYYYPFSLAIIMFIGPTIYWYIKTLIIPNFKLSLLVFIKHALPAVPAIVYIIYFSLLTPDNRIEWLLKDYITVRHSEYYINILFYIQLVFYILLSLRIVLIQLKKTRWIIFNHKIVDIQWTKNFFIIALTSFVGKVIVCIWINSDKVNTQIGLLLMDVLFVYFFIQSVWKTGLFMQSYQETPKSAHPSIKIEPDKVKRYIDSILDVMQERKLYLLENCTLDDLSEALNISKHQLSHILNTHFNRNFTEFVNEYRIRYACELLSDKKNNHLTIEALGLMCGFGSKTSFNRAFKKQMDQTPTEYKQSLT